MQFRDALSEPVSRMVIPLRSSDSGRKGIDFRPIAQARNGGDEIERLPMLESAVVVFEVCAQALRKHLEFLGVHILISIGRRAGARFAAAQEIKHGMGMAQKYSAFVVPRRVRAAGDGNRS